MASITIRNLDDSLKAMLRMQTTQVGVIAAIAIQHHLPLVTRNTKDFLQIEGLRLINPWLSKSA